MQPESLADPIAALTQVLARINHPLSLTIERPGWTATVTIRTAAGASAAPSHAAEAPRPDLPTIEADIIEALGTGTMTARELAAAAGYRLNSHLRGVLARMRRRGLLHHNGDGYVR